MKHFHDEPLIRIVDDEDEVRESLCFMLECEASERPPTPRAPTF